MKSTENPMDISVVHMVIGSRLTCHTDKRPKTPTLMDIMAMVLVRMELMPGIIRRHARSMVRAAQMTVEVVVLPIESS